MVTRVGDSTPTPGNVETERAAPETGHAVGTERQEGAQRAPRAEPQQPRDSFAARGPRPRPMGEAPTSPGSPIDGSRGAGRPQGPRLGQGTESLPPASTDRAIPVDRRAYMATHRGDANATRRIITEGQFFVPGTQQGWDDLVRQVYGEALGENASPETIQLLAEAVAQLNGRSSLEAPPSIVAMPQLEDVNRYLRGMQRMLSVRPHHPTVRPAVQRDGGENYRTAPAPTQGYAYETRWNDSLRGVVLQAYRSHLVGLTPEEADHRLRCIMLAVANINGLNTTDLQDAGVIWLPTPEQIRSALTQLDNRQAMEQVQRDHPDLWESIVRTGTDAVRDLAYFEGRDVELATPTVRLAERISAADGTVRVARFQQALAGPTGFNVFNLTNFNLLLSLFQEEPPPAEELPIRREGEDLAAYLDRVAPNLPPEQYRRIMESPGLLMMVSAGIINGNGDIDQGRCDEFMSAMQRLGVVDSEGNWNVTPQEGETPEQAVNRVTFEALRRMGLEVDDSLGLEAAIAQAQANATPQQQQLIHQLVIWNQLLLLGPADAEGEATGAGGASNMLQGNMEKLLAPSSYGFRNYNGKPLDYLRNLEIEPINVGHDFYDLDRDKAEESRDAAAARIEATARRHAAQRRQSAGPMDEQQVEEARRFAATEEVIERDRRYAREVMRDSVEEAADVNRRLADGLPVGGPGGRQGDGET